jgi:succinylglutamate desuccinylase
MSGLLHKPEYLPEKLLSASATELCDFLSGPSLIHLEGRRKDPLFVSVLLHGNEDTGLLAVQNLLRNHAGKELPRSLSLFVGNIEAAREGMRRLDGQPDYNRVWPGGDLWQDSAEAAMMREIVDEMRGRNVFASVDVHNNTGLNPHYACVNKLDHQYLQLATLFGRTVVYFIRPRGVQSMAFAELCPATTLECGKPHQPNGVEHATNYLDACLHLSELPNHPVAQGDIDLFHTVAQVTLPNEAAFSFDHDKVDIQFNPDLDHMNFREVPAGTEWGVVHRMGSCPVARGEQGEIVTREYFDIKEDKLVLKRAVMPSMLTLDEQVIRQDCLCYLMERLPPPA